MSPRRRVAFQKTEFTSAQRSTVGLAGAPRHEFRLERACARTAGAALWGPSNAGGDGRWIRPVTLGYFADPTRLQRGPGRRLNWPQPAAQRMEVPRRSGRRKPHVASLVRLPHRLAGNGDPRCDRHPAVDIVAAVAVAALLHHRRGELGGRRGKDRGPDPHRTPPGAVPSPAGARLGIWAGTASAAGLDYWRPVPACVALACACVACALRMLYVRTPQRMAGGRLTPRLVSLASTMWSLARSRDGVFASPRWCCLWR